MKIEGLVFLKAYAQRKMGNLNNPYRVYEEILDESTNYGYALIWNVNNFDYQVVKCELNPVNLIKEEVPEIFVKLINGFKE